MNELLTIPQLCEKYKTGKATVRGWIRRGSAWGLTFTPSDQSMPNPGPGKCPFRLYHVRTAEPEARFNMPKVNAPVDARCVNHTAASGVLLKVALTDFQIEEAKVLGIHPIAYAVAATFGRHIHQIKVLSDELLVWSNQRIFCAAGYQSHWISVSLPADARAMVRSLARGDKLFPFSFDLRVSEGITSLCQMEASHVN